MSRENNKSKLTENREVEAPTSEKPKNCFVIMPISGVEGYGFDYFSDIYKYLIKEVCQELDIKVSRADEEKATNLIQADILKKLIAADLVICDISFHNPNVLFELGIRQAFDKPVVLIKDKETKTIFDISSIRYIEYDRKMKYEEVRNFQTLLKETIEQTISGNLNGINSLIKLVQFTPVDINEKNGEINENKLMYQVLDNLAKEISEMKRTLNKVEENRDFITNKEIAETLMMSNIRKKENVEDKIMYYENKFYNELKKLEERILKTRLLLGKEESIKELIEIIVEQDKLLEEINKLNVPYSLKKEMGEKIISQREEARILLNVNF